MASIRARNGKLFFDFYYQGIRCREQTSLNDSKLNRSRLESILRNIEAQIRLDRFVYSDMFPDSKRCDEFKKYDDQIRLVKESEPELTDQLLVNIPT